MFKSSLLDVSAQFVHNGRIGGGKKYRHGTLKGFSVSKRRILCGTQTPNCILRKVGRSHRTKCSRIHQWSGNVYKKNGPCHRSEKLERYKAKYQRFYCDWYIGTYNEICVADHIKPLITKQLTFSSCFPLKQDRWDFQNIDNANKMILDIASDRYKGWRLTFNATYKEYNDYDERMKKHPEDLDIAEWHYLMLYFRTEKLQVR
jgi:hypothetical protein